MQVHCIFQRVPVHRSRRYRRKTQSCRYRLKDSPPASPAEMFTEHFHDPTIAAQIDIDIFNIGHPFLAAKLKHSLQAVRRSFVGTENSKFFLSRLSFITSRKMFRVRALPPPGHNRVSPQPRRNHGSAASTTAAKRRRHWHAGSNPCVDGR
jgi:hypothetical protein